MSKQVLTPIIDLNIKFIGLYFCYCLVLYKCRRAAVRHPRAGVFAKGELIAAGNVNVVADIVVDKLEFVEEGESV